MIAIAAIVLLASSALLPCDPSVVVSGVVVDASGAVVAEAVVRVDGPAGRAVTLSGPDGRFAVTVCAAAATVTATSPGFGETVAQVDARGDVAGLLKLVLPPAVLAERVQVTSGEKGASLLTPGALSIVGGEETREVPLRPIDDALRRIPGFSLLRLSSSRVANPTAQGVSMRGVGASGASRALVLADGTPLNDPFGGWVYWNRIPEAAVDRVEVARGAASDRFGGAAVGGVIDLITMSAARSTFLARTSVATGGQAGASFLAGRPFGRWSIGAAAQAAALGGYFVVPPGDRGPVDERAGGDAGSGLLRIDYVAGEQRSVRVESHVNVFGESRRNGTPLQDNSTRLGDVFVAAHALVGTHAVEVRGGFVGQRFRQSFSAVSGDRSSERLTGRQDLPAHSARGGGSWSWSSPRARVSASGEFRDVAARGTEWSFAPSGTSTAGPLGGRERLVAGGAQGELFVSRAWSASLGVRFDRWQTTAVDGATTARARTQASPRASVTWQATSRLAAQASFYRGFRAPTLNELYRGFRVGNTVTRPNAALDPERLTGGEIGVLWASPRANVRGILFSHHLDGPVTNVTIEASPALIVRERQNAGAVLASGTEVEGDLAVRPWLRARVAAALTRSRLSAAQLPSIDGRDTPHVPGTWWSAGFSAAMPGGLRLEASVRYTGRRYEDDRNTLPLDASWLANLSLSSRITSRVTVFAAVENVADAADVIGRTPLPLAGLPRIVHVGIGIGPATGR